MSVSVIHLCRKANGTEPLRRFLKAYHETQPDQKHTLVLAFKGFSSMDEALDYVSDDYYKSIEQNKTTSAQKVARTQKGFNDNEVFDVVMGDGQQICRRYPDTGYDLSTYRRAALDCTTDYVMFMNSFSRPLVDGWLAKLMNVMRLKRVGIVGCTGSLEISPHIRTNAFVMSRELFLACVERVNLTREECLALETGPRSITNQVLARGLSARVVGAHTEGSIDDRRARIFRWGEQDGLLVEDNRTLHYARASEAEREWLRNLAWGNDHGSTSQHA